MPTAAGLPVHEVVVAGAPLAKEPDVAARDADDGGHTGVREVADDGVKIVAAGAEHVAEVKTVAAAEEPAAAEGVADEEAGAGSGTPPEGATTQSRGGVSALGPGLSLAAGFNVASGLPRPEGCRALPSSHLLLPLPLAPPPADLSQFLAECLPPHTVQACTRLQPLSWQPSLL